MAIAKRDYYEVLGVPHDADTEAIKTAYRKLALKYHPDRNKDAGATQHFKEITEAFAVLSDPQKRTRYDAHGHAGIAGFTPEDLFGEIDFGDLFGRHGLDFGGGLLDGLFGRRRRDALRGADIEVSLTISLEKVLKGGQETVHFSRPTACQACSATGAQPGTTPKSCDACQGTGRQVASRTDQGVSFQQITPCRTCHGRGVVIEQPCGECGGQAVVHRAETLSVKIPPGIKDGMALRIAGHGHPSEKPGGVPGDLHVRVFSQRDPRFERRGPHLWREVTIPLVDAVLGTQLETPTLSGQATVTVPPGSQPGTVLRLPGEGLPMFAAAARGDLYLAIRLKVPRQLSEEERALYQQLRDCRLEE